MHLVISFSHLRLHTGMFQETGKGELHCERLRLARLHTYQERTCTLSRRGWYKTKRVRTGEVVKLITGSVVRVAVNIACLFIGTACRLHEFISVMQSWSLTGFGLNIQ